MQLFKLMPCRYDSLVATIEGYKKTGVELVAFNNDCMVNGENIGLGPAGYSDDIGSYYFIPKLVEIFSINLDTAIQIFYSGSVFLAGIVAIISSWFFCDTKLGKCISAIAIILLSAIVAGISDTYTFMAIMPLVFIPWWLNVQRQKNPNFVVLFFITAGIIMSCSHLVRSHSATPVIAFVLISLLFFSDHFSNRLKAFSILIFMIVGASVFLAFDSLIEVRIDYLTNIGLSESISLSGSRIMWHNIYYSLGYLWNTYDYTGQFLGHEPSDTYSVVKALSINPDVVLFSAEYENILRLETISFIKNHPLFFLHTIFSKVGVVLMYIILFTNIGLISLLYYSRGTVFNFLFIVGIGMSSLWCLVGLPLHFYLMGLFTFCTLFGVYNIDYAIKMRTKSF